MPAVRDVWNVDSGSHINAQAQPRPGRSGGRDVGWSALILIQASFAARGSSRMAVSQHSILQGGDLDELLYAAA
jgi:hypothetical protein